MIFLKAIFYSCVAYIVWSLATLARHYRAAQKIGLPVLVTPIDVVKPFWYLQRKMIAPLALKLPFGLGSWAHRMEAHWTYRDRYAIHARYGPAFSEVSPWGIKVFLADDAGVEDILKRSNDYIKDPNLYGPLEVFGPNVSDIPGPNEVVMSGLSPPMADGSRACVPERHVAVSTAPSGEEISRYACQASDGADDLRGQPLSLQITRI